MTNLPKVLVAIPFIAFVITICSLLLSSNIVRSRLNSAKQESNQEVVLQDSFSKLTASQVATHSQSSDCWMIIDFKVYNLTSYLVAHPGGVDILAAFCGRDGTQAYKTKTRSPAETHSNNADKILSQFYLGDLESGDNSTVSTVTITPTVKSVTKSQITNSSVSTHTTASDCWITISSKVYAVSSYLAIHPGGSSVITPYCGKDATNAFASKGKNPGQTHSVYAQTLLSNYLVGNISSTNSPILTPTPLSLSPTNNIQNLSSSIVSAHASASDCWSIINNNVYNLTSYLVMHPGGVGAITPYCGKDGTNAFNSRGGTGNHSNTAKSLLNNYIIGSLGSNVTTQNTQSSIVSTPNPSSSFACLNLPATICSQYPNAIYQSGKYEDDGVWEGKITVNGDCKAIKVNSSGSITENKGC